MPENASELDRLVRDYTSMVQGALRRLGVAEPQLDDASQEVFLVLARRFAEYDAQRSLASWLWGIARGVASTHRRSHRRRSRLEAAVAAQPDPVQPSMDEALARRQARDMLRTFLASLDEDKCAVFVLAELEGCSGPEIAARLDVNLNTVYARLRAARRRFEEAVEQRRGIAAASAWVGIRWCLPKVATVSLSTALAAAVVAPTLAVSGDASAPSVAAEVSLGEPQIEVLASSRKAGPPAKVRDESDDSTMSKSLSTFALAATLTAPTLAHAKPTKARPAPVSDQDADDAALVSDLETREYIFDADDVEGETLGPGGVNVTSRVNVHHESLIRIRGHFISELITLATDV